MTKYLETGAILFQEKRRWVIYVPYYDKKFFGKKKSIVNVKASKFKTDLNIIELDKEILELLKDSGRFTYCMLLGFIFSGGKCNWDISENKKMGLIPMRKVTVDELADEYGPSSFGYRFEPTELDK